MDITQIILGLIAALATLLLSVAGVIRLSGTIANRAVEGERTARAALEKELRADIATERGELEKARFRIQELETARIRDADKIKVVEDENCVMRGQVGTLINETGALRVQIEIIEKKYAAEREISHKLDDENAELRRQNAQLFESNKLLKIETATYRSALALIGDKVSEKVGAEPPERAPESVAPDINQETHDNG